MANRKQPPARRTDLKDWNVYHLAKTGKWIGNVRAPDAATAFKLAVKEYRIPERNWRRTIVRESP